MILAIFVGVIVGLVLGLTGAGGSVLAVPLLVLLLGLPADQAIGVSLGAVFISATLGVLLRLRSQQVQWIPAIVFIVFGAALAPLGSYLGHLVPETFLLSGFSVLVFVIAVGMWREAQASPELTHSVRARPNTAVQSDLPAQCGEQNLSMQHFRFYCFVRIAFAAAITGILSGLFGVGGGFLIVPALMTLLSVGIEKAASTSLVVIVGISLSGFISFMQLGAGVDFVLLRDVAMGGGIGMLIGTFASRKLSGPLLQKTFAVAMVVLASTSLVQQFL
jgi:uncharacterized membrane protein YfcA